MHSTFGWSQLQVQQLLLLLLLMPLILWRVRALAKVHFSRLVRVGHYYGVLPLYILPLPGQLGAYPPAIR